jgi:hypothetical protein
MERINGLDSQDLELDDIEYMQQVKDLEDQPYDSLEKHADNDPVMILDSYFEEYAQTFAEDIGAVSETNEWPNYCIDWKWAARDLQMDYTTVEFGGYTYHTR